MSKGQLSLLFNYTTKQALDRTGQETSSILWCKGLEFTGGVSLYCNNHRRGLYLFILKSIPLRIIPDEPSQSEKWETLPLDEQWLNLITVKFRKGKGLAPLSLITDSRWTKVHMNYAWGKLKKLYKKFKLWLFVFFFFFKNPCHF